MHMEISREKPFHHSYKNKSKKQKTLRLVAVQRNRDHNTEDAKFQRTLNHIYMTQCVLITIYLLHRTSLNGMSQYIL